MKLHHRRGQSIVLFALTLLLLAMMVMMTIGFGMKAKEKMEMQYLADAAAYSNAVATARALNGVAILNRAEVAVMVTMAATQSNISFASTYMGTLNAISDWAGKAAIIAGACCASIYCPFQAACCSALGPINTTNSNASNKYNQLYNKYYQSGQLDHKAGKQARSIQGAATTVHLRQREIYFSNRDTFIKGQKLAAEIVLQASQGHRWAAEYKVDDPAGKVSWDEILTRQGVTAGPSPGDAQFFALSPRNTSRELGAKAAMATRGEKFVRDRDGYPLSAKLLADRIPSQGIITVNSNGSGQWTDGSGGGHHHPGPGPAPYSSAADDEGSIRGQVPLGSICPASIVHGSVDSWVYSTDLPDEDDEHDWTGQSNHANGDKTFHTMGDCTACPGVWTMFIDLNPEIIGPGGPGSPKVKQYLWGQPKNFAVVRRDTNVRCGDGTYTDHCGADPWNLMFRFRFTPTGEKFDNRGLKLSNGQNISNQILLASGITYYHRPGHWKEPPNFFNPFWRGTLSSVMVDAQGDPASGSDVVTSISRTGAPSASTARDVVNRLARQGYEGW